MHLELMKQLVWRDTGGVAQRDRRGCSRLPQRSCSSTNSRVPGGSRAETRKREQGPRIAPAQAGGSGAEPDPPGQQWEDGTSPLALVLQLCPAEQAQVTPTASAMPEPGASSPPAPGGCSWFLHPILTYPLLTQPLSLKDLGKGRAEPRLCHASTGPLFSPSQPHRAAVRQWGIPWLNLLLTHYSPQSEIQKGAPKKEAKLSPASADV